jgi:SHS2 domain-containing protein
MPELFANAARALFSVITDLKTIRESERQEIEARAADREALLVAWLNEFIYRFDSEQWLFRRFEVREVTKTKVRAIAYGERADTGRHPIKTGVKSATYHQLRIEKRPGGYRAKVIVDV